MDIAWVDGFTIKTGIDAGVITVSANAEGLTSLADILLALAQGAPGDHIHLDEHNSLEDGSCELVIERLPM